MTQHEAGSPRAYGLGVGIPTVPTNMMIFTVMHPTNILIKIIVKISSKVIHLGAKITARARMEHMRGRLRFRAQGSRVRERATNGAGQDLVPCEMSTYKREVDHGPVQSLVEALNEHGCLCRKRLVILIKQNHTIRES